MNLASLPRIVLIVALVADAGCSSSPVPQQQRTATVLHVEGEVTGTKSGQPARFAGGEPLVADDIVTTAPASMAVLLLSNGWVTRLDASTTLRVGGLVAFDKEATSTSPATQLEQLLDAGERARLPANDVLAERVAGVEQRLRAASSPAATSEVDVPSLRATAPSAEGPAANAAPPPAAQPPAPPPPAAAPLQRSAANRPSAPAFDVGGGAPASREESESAPRSSSALAEKKDASAALPSIRQLGVTKAEDPAGVATMDALRARSAALGACSTEASGVVIVVVGVDRGGAVTAVSIQRDDTGAPGMAACVAEVVRRTRLPTRAEPASIRIEVRFGATDAR